MSTRIHKIILAAICGASLGVTQCAKPQEPVEPNQPPADATPADDTAPPDDGASADDPVPPDDDTLYMTEYGVPPDYDEPQPMYGVPME